MANYSEIYCALSDCEGVSRHLLILRPEIDLRDHQSIKHAIFWFSEEGRQLELMSLILKQQENFFKAENVQKYHFLDGL